MSTAGLNNWGIAITGDKTFFKVITKCQDSTGRKDVYHQYQEGSNDLINPKDWNGHIQLHVPDSLRTSITEKPFGLLLSISIPLQLLQVVSKDFTPELLTSNGDNNTLVIVDEPMNCTIYIPTMTTITKMGTAEFLFRQVISRFGIPR
jgi:hypothetical protein